MPDTETTTMTTTRKLALLAMLAFCAATLAVVATATIAGPAQSSAAAAPPVLYIFTGGMAAFARNPEAAPPGANDWSCKPSPQHPRPVVLVHGTFASANLSWNALSPL